MGHTEAGVEPSSFQSYCRITSIWRVGGICAVEWLQSGTVAEPEAAISAEENERECIAKVEFEYATEYYEQTAHEEVHSAMRSQDHSYNL